MWKEVEMHHDWQAALQRAASLTSSVMLVWPDVGLQSGDPTGPGRPQQL